MTKAAKKQKADAPLTRVTTIRTEVPVLKQFYLRRKDDESGISGTGIVATGVMYPSGMCIMEWLTPVKSIGHYHSIADLEAIHGHNGKTEVKWVEEE